jgi:hypothetical protein
MQRPPEESVPQDIVVPQFRGNILVRIDFDAEPPVYIRVFEHDLQHLTLRTLAPPDATVLWRLTPIFIPCKKNPVYTAIVNNPDYVFVDMTADGVIVLRYSPQHTSEPDPDSNAVSARDALIAFVQSIGPPAFPKGMSKGLHIKIKRLSRK